VYVRPGDEIVIPRAQPYVSVVGEVVRPGSIPFESGMDADAYVARAGGYSSRAARHDVAVIRGLSGEWSKTNRRIPLGPGDTIWVPKKPERRLWKNTLETIGFVAQLATVYVVVDNAVHR
jgi:protein involved in polysaccharide export with SLBB domain